MYRYQHMETLEQIRLVPVLVLEDADHAVPLANALVAGGIPMAEVTFRTPAAAESIRRMAAEVPEILVGAGTVHDVKTAEAAVKSGAKFIVTPGFNEPVVDWCIANHVDVYPGCTTPSDLECLLLKGLSIAKFFPAEAYGGVKVLKAFSGPYAGLRFMPTGGITQENVGDYLALSSVIACGGAWMAPESLIQAENFAEITALCKKACAGIS